MTRQPQQRAGTETGGSGDEAENKLEGKAEASRVASCEDLGDGTYKLRWESKSRTCPSHCGP